jgi:nucleoside-diphosphate-sugar epimerase
MHSSAYTVRSSYVHDLKEGYMSRSVVPAVAGFIGSHRAEYLVTLGHEVVGSDCFTPYYCLRRKRANLAALMANQKGDVGHTAADCERAQRLLGFVPAANIVEGLHRLVAWQRGVCTMPRQEGGRLAVAV